MVEREKEIPGNPGEGSGGLGGKKKEIREQYPTRMENKDHAR